MTRVGLKTSRVPSGDYIAKVTPVPISNTVVKLCEPMIVPTSAKVGIAGFLKSLVARKSCKAFFVSLPSGIAMFDISNSSFCSLSPFFHCTSLSLGEMPCVNLGPMIRHTHCRRLRFATRSHLQTGNTIDRAVSPVQSSVPVQSVQSSVPGAEQCPRCRAVSPVQSSVPGAEQCPRCRAVSPVQSSVPV